MKFELNIQHKVVPKFDESQPIVKTAKDAQEKERVNQRISKRKSKPMPIRGRRLKTMASKGSFSVDVKQHKSSSVFDIQQNDMLRTVSYFHLTVTKIVCSTVEDWKL